MHAYVHSVPDVAESGSKSSSMLLVSVLQFQLMGSELLSPASVHLCVSVGVHMCSLPPPEETVGRSVRSVFVTVPWKCAVHLAEVGQGGYH